MSIQCIRCRYTNIHKTHTKTPSMVVLRQSPPPMDPKIWSHLPEHLLDHTLSFLPLRNFLKLTSTCKRFKSLLSSPVFISKHATSALLSPFLLLSHPQVKNRLPLYDTNLTFWRTLPHHANMCLLSVSRGVLCFSLPRYQGQNKHAAQTVSCSATGYYPYFIVSGLISTSKIFIKFPNLEFKFDSVTLICSRVGFKIFVLCSSNCVYLYDSVSGQWEEFDLLGSILSGNCQQEPVYYNRCLWFVTPEPFSIVSFDLETGVWETRDIVVPVELTFARLASDGGEKLCLVGGIGQHGISRGVKIWELEKNGSEWVEIESLPELICRKFMSICYHNYDNVYCFWHQGLICVCCYNWPEVLYYKVLRKTWHWLPKNPSLLDKWSFGFRWFSLVPELHAFV